MLCLPWDTFLSHDQRSLSHLVTASLISDIETSVNRCFAIVRLLILCAKCDGVGVILMKETNTPGL